MKPNQWTAIILIGLLTIFIFWDILALVFFGADATISVVLNIWAFKAHPLLVFCAGMIFGGLVVHFLGWAPKDEQIKLK